MVDVLLTHSYHLSHDAKQLRKMQPYPSLGTLYAAKLAAVHAERERLARVGIRACYFLQGLPRRRLGRNQQDDQLLHRYRDSGSTSYLAPWARNQPRFIGALSRIHRALCNLPVLRVIGDHMLLHFEKTGS